MKPTLLDSKYILENKFMKIRQDRVQFSHGDSKDFFVLEGPAWVCIVAFTPQNEIIFTRQYRPTLRQTVLELPAGKLDAADPSPQSAALREFEEEVGYTLEKIEFLGKVSTIPGRANVDGYVYMGNLGIKQSQKLEDAEESLVVERLTIPQIRDAIRNGELFSAPILAALALAHAVHPERFTLK